MVVKREQNSGGAAAGFELGPRVVGPSYQASARHL